MTAWLSGMEITADRLNDFTPVTLGDTATAATNFTLNTYTSRKGAGSVEFETNLTYTGAGITAASGDVADTLCLTLPTTCRPLFEAYVTYESGGTKYGTIRIGTDGTCKITTASATLPTSTTIKFSGVFVTG